VIIRQATPGDELAVARVHVRAWQQAYRGLLPDEHLDGLRPEERAARYTFGSRDPADPHTIVALEGEVVHGFATTGPSRDEDAPGLGELYALYVEPSAWGRGVGGLLHERALERMRALGPRGAILWVLTGNEQAERFYRARGWGRDGARRWEEPYGVRSRVIRYRRALTGEGHHRELAGEG
jgi:GNAT superfamily N-acetyltransferase